MAATARVPVLALDAAAATASSSQQRPQFDDRGRTVFGGGDFGRNSATFGGDGVDVGSGRSAEVAAEDRALYAAVASRRYSPGNVVEDDAKSFDETDDVEGLHALVHFRNIAYTRMWANAQRDGRPAEYRWCPLFNAAKFGQRPLLECRVVTLPRRQTR